MAFPIDLKYIKQTEDEFQVKFPKLFIERMLDKNGGETENEEFQIFPFWDKSDRKRLSRTSNNIGLETKNAKNWSMFPERAIAIGADGTGNLLILLHQGNGQLDESIHLWNHENGTSEIIAVHLGELDRNN